MKENFKERLSELITTEIKGKPYLHYIGNDLHIDIVANNTLFRYIV